MSSAVWTTLLFHNRVILIFNISLLSTLINSGLGRILIVENNDKFSLFESIVQVRSECLMCNSSSQTSHSGAPECSLKTPPGLTRILTDDFHISPHTFSIIGIFFYRTDTCLQILGHENSCNVHFTL